MNQVIREKKRDKEMWRAKKAGNNLQVADGDKY